jgi:acylphosphatase
VEVKAAGTSQALDELRERLGRGPTSARVQSVEELDADPDTSRAGFHIDR